MKCEVGRIMALEGIPEDSIWSIAQGPLNTCLLSFELSDGSVRGPWTLDHTDEFVKSRERLEFVNELNRKNDIKQSKSEPSGMPRFPGHPGRLYMAGTARFLTRAREAEWVGGEHPYAYALTNPVTYVDPDGNKPIRGSGMGENFGECAVYICEEKKLPGSIPSHKYICVSGPGGGCSGGLYPDGQVIGPGVIDNRNESCKSRREPYRVDCTKVASGCDIASRVCSCVKDSFSNPGAYVFPVRTCYTYPREMIWCACKALGPKAMVRIDACFLEMNVIA